MSVAILLLLLLAIALVVYGLGGNMPPPGYPK